MAGREAIPAALTGFFKSAAVVRRFEYQFRHGMGSAFQIQRDVRKVGRAGVFALARETIFREYLYADLHRSVEHAVHIGLENYKFADVDW